MNKIWLIIQREYITRVRKKSFLLLTFLSPLGFALIIILPLLLTNIDQEKQKILVKDDSGFIDVLKDSSGIYMDFRYGDLPMDSLRKKYRSLGYDALLYIPAINPENPRNIEIFSEKQISLITESYLESVIADKLESENLKSLNLDKKDLKKLRPEVDIENAVTSGTKQRKGSAVLSTIIGYIMGFSIYIVLLIYGTMVMRGVMEEKTNRIIEVIVSSVKPFQLMLGKILGIGAVGLTQFAIWVVLLFFIQLIVGILFIDELSSLQELAASPSSQDVNSQMRDLAKAYRGLANINYGQLIFSFIFYFFGGYLLYSALFAAVGSLANDDGGDIQLYTFPVTLPIIISIIIMVTVIQTPDSNLAFWASIIPLSSPIVMPARIPFQVPAWEIALSGSLLILGFILTTWMAARIYRTGILMYGKKIKISEIAKWLFYRE